MRKINDDLRKKLKNVYSSNPSNRDIEAERRLIGHILKEHAEEIVDLAYENIGGAFSGHVFVDPISGDLHAFTWTGNTTLSSESNLIFVYKLSANWVSNNAWELNDILSDEELKALHDKFERDADFLDKKQLAAIGIDLNKRLKEYLVWNLTTKRNSSPK